MPSRATWIGVLLTAGGVAGGMLWLDRRAERRAADEFRALARPLTPPPTLSDIQQSVLDAVREREVGPVNVHLRDPDFDWRPIATRALRAVIDIEAMRPRDPPDPDRAVWIELADRVVAAGADVDACWPRVTTPAEAEFFVSHGVAVDHVAPGARGTLLYWRAADRWLDLERFLLDRGANPNAVGHRGDTPLHESARNDAPRVAELLLARGAKPGAKNDAGQTALELARQLHHTRVGAVLAGG
jgi:hypothetical protein